MNPQTYFQNGAQQELLTTNITSQGLKITATTDYLSGAPNNAYNLQINIGTIPQSNSNTKPAEVTTSVPVQPKQEVIKPDPVKVEAAKPEAKPEVPQAAPAKVEQVVQPQAPPATPSKAEGKPEPAKPEVKPKAGKQHRCLF